MKKITFLIIVLLTASISFGQELITSGGFEGLSAGNPDGNLTGATTPWQSPSGGVRVINNSANAHTGDQYVNMDNDFRNLRQSITATANTEYTATLWYFFPSPQGTVDSDDGIFVSIRDNTGGNGTQFDPIISFYIDPSINEGTWQQLTFDFTAPQSDLLFFVGKQARNADGDGGNNNAARLDDISIVEKTLSVNNLSKFNFKTYPNPAKDYLYVSSEKSINKIEVYGILGQQVLNKNIDFKRAEVNVSSLTSGIYLVKAYIDDAVGTYKFVKQ